MGDGEGKGQVQIETFFFYRKYECDIKEFNVASRDINLEPNIKQSSYTGMKLISFTLP